MSLLDRLVRRARDAAGIQIDPDYSDRKGYDPGFLGADGQPVELPVLTEALAAQAALNTRATGEPRHVLPYHHFSVVLNKERRLAFFTAVNIDGSTSKDFDRNTGVMSDPMQDDDSEAAELWFPEHRIEDNEQTPRDFYEGQPTFDA